MKKFLIYVFIIFFIVFIMPSIFTQKRKIEVKKNLETEQKVEDTKEESTYEYKNFAMIKLYHVKSDNIEEIPLDEYLYGVVSSEIPVSYNIEALKAQAVAARTYTIYQIINSTNKHNNADMCDNFACCQAWISKEERMNRWKQSEAKENWNKIVQAVKSTQGEIITYENKPIDAFFHSNSGGKTETPVNVWGGTNFPYLQSVETAGENEYKEYQSEVQFTKDELINKLKDKYPEIEINLEDENSIEILELTESGRVRTIKIGNIKLSGVEVRKILGLRSTNFKPEINR